MKILICKSFTAPGSVLLLLALSLGTPAAHGALHYQQLQGTFTAYAFTNFLGTPGGPGNVDGFGETARFNFWTMGAPFGVEGPVAIAVDGHGNLFVADSANCTIRKITSKGVVTTLAGVPGQAGSDDGVGSAAHFNFPCGIALDSSDNLIVADTGNNLIRTISPEGLVKTLAGDASIRDSFGLVQTGFADGVGRAARFYWPAGVAVSHGLIYVTDSFNNGVRVITPDGLVRTLAGAPTPGPGESPAAGYADGVGHAARFNNPRGLVVDSTGNLFLADTYNQLIRKVTPAGEVSTVAGNPTITDQSGYIQPGYQDGVGKQAQFNRPGGLVLDSGGNLYVADTGNDVIRRIVAADSAVSTYAGSAGTYGSSNGSGPDVQFYGPSGLGRDQQGLLYVADGFNDAVRTINAQGVVSTLAGAPPSHVEVDSWMPGKLLAVRSLTVDSSGNVYFTDGQNLRKVSPTGDLLTAPLPLQSDSIAVDSSGEVYAGAYDWTIKKITSSGTISTLAGDPGNGGSDDGKGSEARFGAPGYGSPLGVTVDKRGNVYVADELNNTIRKVTPDGTVTTLAGQPPTPGQDPWTAGAYADGPGVTARFNMPLAVAINSTGTVFVADTENFVIRRLTPDGMVDTFAGVPGQTGSLDGKGSSALFREPVSIALDQTGNLYVMDWGAIRKIGPDRVVTTVAGLSGTFGDQDGIGSAAQFSSYGIVALATSGTIYVGDLGNDRITRGRPTIIPAPRLNMSSVAPDMFSVTVAGLLAGTRVILETSADLRVWSPVRSEIASGPSVVLDLRALSPSAARFVRAAVK